MARIQARAMYDFASQNEDELSFRTGEVLTVVSQYVGDGYEGWWLGRSASAVDTPPPPPPPPPPPSYENLAPQPRHYQQFQQQQASPVAPPPPKESFFADESWSSDDDDGGASAVTPRNVARGGGGAAVTNRAGQGSRFSVAGTPGQGPAGAPALRKAVSSTLSTTSAEANNRKTIRGLPKVAGIKEFLLTDEVPPVTDVDTVTVVLDGQELAWQPREQAFTCKVTDPSKASKMRGLKSYIAYQISTSANPDLVVSRRYKHFDWLHKQLCDKFPCVAVPPLPDKQVTGRYEESFINARMRQLQCWMNRMSAHPVTGPSLVFQHFLTCTDEGKRWKEGKRRAEQDKLSRGQVYHTIRLSAPCDLTDMERYTDAFDGFATEMDTATRLAMDTALSHSKKCENNIRKEYSRIADACFAMEKAACLVPNNKLDQLSQAMHAAGQSYQQVSELWAQQPRSDSDQLAEALHEYSGLISCLPAVISIGRGSIATARDCQRGLEEGRISPAEAQETTRRAALVSAAQCAEMNNFRREVDADYKAMMANFLREQVRFHQEIANKLQAALDTFSY
uniref:Sorting nexin n=1 Tax=Macrostomum lignano TaxID=282301 RepID=A0A1I8HCE8_9PLAT